MSTDVEIARLALQHIGDRFDISSLGEEGTEAEQVREVFNPTRDALLRGHPWAFATKYASPASLVGTPPKQWQYMYQYPSDCLRMIEVISPVKGEFDVIPFEVAINSDNAKVIMTDEVDAEIKYTRKVTDSNEFDAEFVMALSYAIAARIAMPLTGDLNIANFLRGQAAIEASGSMESNSNEGYENQDRMPDWINARA